MKPTESLLSVPQVARRLGLSSDWVYRAAREGSIPCVRLGRYVRFRPASVETWLADLEGGVALGARMSAEAENIRQLHPRSSGNRG
jgi:excisionase family DNA binding protein